jgi:hypothetical protein
MQQPGATPQVNIPKYPEALKARDEIKTVDAHSGIPRLQRFDNISRSTWAVGPGFHISRLWRLPHSTTADYSSMFHTWTNPRHPNIVA